MRRQEQRDAPFRSGDGVDKRVTAVQPVRPIIGRSERGQRHERTECSANALGARRGHRQFYAGSPRKTTQNTQALTRAQTAKAASIHAPSWTASTPRLRGKVARKARPTVKVPSPLPSEIALTIIS